MAARETVDLLERVQIPLATPVYPISIWYNELGQIPDGKPVGYFLSVDVPRTQGIISVGEFRDILKQDLRR